MIFGEIDELKFYRGISRELDSAINFILENKVLDRFEGKNEILGEKLFFNIQNVETKKLKDCFFESHREYMDIHIIIEGEELIGYAQKGDLKLNLDYNESSDFQTLSGKMQNSFHMKKGNFIMFFPNEPHMPLIAPSDETKGIKKAVFKIKM